MTTLKEYYDLIKDFTIAVNEYEVTFVWKDAKGNNASVSAWDVRHKLDNTSGYADDLESYLEYFGSQEVANIAIDCYDEVIEIHLSPDAEMKKICEEVAVTLDQQQITIYLYTVYQLITGTLG